MLLQKRRLSVLAESRPGLPADEGIMKANGRKIASNAQITWSLFSRNHILIADALPCWTGTWAAYEEPGRAFQRTVEYQEGPKTWVFIVPDEFIGEKNSVIVCDHPHFHFEVDGNKRIVHPSKAAIVNNFPAENGIYKSDPVHDIPVAEKMDFKPDEARYLARIGRRVGPVKRAPGYDGNSFGLRKNICLDAKPSEPLGIAVHWKEGDQPTVKFKRAFQEFVIFLEGVNVEDFRGLLDAARKEADGNDQLAAIQRFLRAFRE